VLFYYRTQRYEYGTLAMSEGWSACDALIDESWNRFGGANIEFMYGGGLTASPYRVYVYKVGSREVVCEWDGENATLSIYPSWYEAPIPPENIS
jgi:hypothetical protein